MATPRINKRMQKIARNYLKGTASVTEQQEFDQWFSKEESEPIMVETSLSKEEHRQQILARIHAETSILPAKSKTRKLWARISVAASALLVLSASAYFILRPKPEQQPQTAQLIGDIRPGGSKAILTLANGEKVQLTGAKNGLLARQGAVVIAKNAEGQLRYSDDQPEKTTDNASLYNTVETPRGGKYKLILADGTTAILDAASSIRYPVAFNGAERKVEITGQVYFEVVHNASKPFRVGVKGQIVEDLGTSFNINAYDDEPVIKTTLIDGSISLTKSGQVTILKPGQQAINYSGITTAGVKVVAANVDEAIAWKNDLFLFNKESLESVMRKISRWYDVDIIYPKNQPIHESYLGGMTRYSNVSQVLKMLEITGDVRFEIKNKAILVLPKQTNKQTNN
ncbi:FecR domain-containing protein [Mucilaginibacter boryungensis]|uniref:DUF4974 domain-containing protein n=2 Tax=Mucilaginibacter boryungensis TaxID=768480 RepID=A0ABR9XHM6_9SPHI|nr:FecR family protein [Mucilaginibacter boryungensis]MBE9666766.1 DUF4974 domain-containing protein [Mucilaginibacter boryungensis]